VNDGLIAYRRNVVATALETEKRELYFINKFSPWSGQKYYTGSVSSYLLHLFLPSKVLRRDVESWAAAFGRPKAHCDEIALEMFDLTPVELICLYRATHLVFIFSDELRRKCTPDDVLRGMALGDHLCRRLRTRDPKLILQHVFRAPPRLLFY